MSNKFCALVWALAVSLLSLSALPVEAATPSTKMCNVVHFHSPSFTGGPIMGRSYLLVLKITGYVQTYVEPGNSHTWDLYMSESLQNGQYCFVGQVRAEVGSPLFTRDLQTNSSVDAQIDSSTDLFPAGQVRARPPVTSQLMINYLRVTQLFDRDHSPLSGVDVSHIGVVFFCEALVSPMGGLRWEKFKCKEGGGSQKKEAQAAEPAKQPWYSRIFAKNRTSQRSSLLAEPAHPPDIQTPAGAGLQKIGRGGGRYDYFPSTPAERTASLGGGAAALLAGAAILSAGDIIVIGALRWRAIAKFVTNSVPRPAIPLNSPAGAQWQPRGPGTWQLFVPAGAAAAAATGSLLPSPGTVKSAPAGSGGSLLPRR